MVGSRNVKHRKFRSKGETLARLGDAKWSVLKGKLRSFEVRLVVSPKVLDGRYLSYHDKEDERVAELEGKIKGIVLRK
jgi:hypothetical protein